MSEVLVTGANGFIGKHICNELAAQCDGVFPFTHKNGDIENPNVFDYVPKSIGQVIHLAACSYVPDSWDNPDIFYRVNFLGTLNVLEFCKKNHLPLIYVSSYIYGAPEKIPVDENAPINPNNPYMHSKYLAEQLCVFYADNFDMDIVILRPFNIYGPGQRDDFLIPTVVRQALTSPDITVMSLTPKRDYLYVLDFVEAVKLCLGKKGMHIYNVGAGQSFSVKEIIDTIQDILTIDKNIVISAKQGRKGEIPDVVADISNIKNKLGWTPKYSLHDGLLQCCKHFPEVKS